VLLDKFVGTSDGLADGVFEGPDVGEKLGIARSVEGTTE
jgi:hypothetical protein